MLLRKFLAPIALLSTLLTPLHSQADPLYSVNLLPGGVDFAPTAMNNAGQIVGFADTGAGVAHAVLYADGALRDIGVTGNVVSFAHAINDTGAVAGTFVSGGEQHGFLYRDGTFTDLGGGTSGEGINARGDVVGGRQSASGLSGYVYRDGVLTELGNLGAGTQDMARDINDLGNIAGYSTIAFDTDPPTVHPFLSNGGAMQDLGPLGANNVTRAVAINNAGQVAGYSEGVDGAHAFLYRLGVMQDLGNLGSEALSIHGMNEQGTLVGTASNEEQGLIPFISLGNALVDLNTLIDPTLGWQIFSAYANNDLGQIVGWGCQGESCGLVRLDLASAVPEPGFAWLLAPGLLVLAARQCRIRGQRSAPA